MLISVSCTGSCPGQATQRSAARDPRATLHGCFGRSGGREVFYSHSQPNPRPAREACSGENPHPKVDLLQRVFVVGVCGGGSREVVCGLGEEGGGREGRGGGGGVVVVGGGGGGGRAGWRREWWRREWVGCGWVEWNGVEGCKEGRGRGTVVQIIQGAHVSTQARTNRASSSERSTGCQCHHIRLALLQRINQPQFEEKSWVAHPLSPTVEQIQEGSTFSIALALEVNKLVWGDCVFPLTPYL